MKYKRNLKKLFVLVKKDLYISLNYIFYFFLMGLILFLLHIFNSKESGFQLLLGSLMIWISMGLAAVVIFTSTMIDFESRNHSFKSLKSLPVNNLTLFISKYIALLVIVFCICFLPVLLIILSTAFVSKFSMSQLQIASYFDLFMGAFIFLILVSAFIYTVLINFSYLTLVIVFQVIGFFLIYLLFKFKGLKGQTFQDFVQQVSNIMGSKFLIPLFFMAMCLIFFLGYMLFDKKMSYRK